MPLASAVQHNLGNTHLRMILACQAARRDPTSVRLLAVSKTVPPEAVAAAHSAGQSAFGENYVQEGLEKIAALAHLPLEWHFIGPIQSNKTRPLAENFDWVHAIDREKIASRLSEQRPAGLPPLDVCIQVNISGEASKSGLLPTELLAVAQAVAALPRLRLRGLMAIPEPTADLVAQRAPHRALRELLAMLNAAGLALDTLSMGMSADLEAAVAEGATLLRVGTAIFGGRAPAVATG